MTDNYLYHRLLSTGGKKDQKKKNIAVLHTVYEYQSDEFAFS